MLHLASLCLSLAAPCGTAPPDSLPSVVAPDTLLAPPPSVDEDSTRRVKIRPLFTPTSLYSSSRGFGIAGGVEVLGLTADDDRLRIETRLSQRLQNATVSYFTHDPYDSPVYGLVAASATTTTRYPFYGIGPRSLRGSKLFLDQLSAEATGRLGWYPLGHTGLLLQPGAQFRFDRLRGYEEAREGALALSDSASLAQLDALIGRPDRYGIQFGLEAASDTRDRFQSPRRGWLVQGGAHRFYALDGSGLRFNRFEASTYGFVPAPLHLGFLPERGTVLARATAVVTRQGGEEPLPYFYLPILDQELLTGYPPYRFVGRDAFSVGLGVRGTIAQFFGAVLVEGMTLAMLGAAYEDLFTEFSPRVTFDPEPVEEGDSVPLRPSLAIGVSLVNIDWDRPAFGVLVGVGPEGLALAAFQIVYDLRTFRPQVK